MYEHLAAHFGPVSHLEDFENLQLKELLSRKTQALAVDCKLLSQGDGHLLIRALLGISDILPTVYFNLTDEVRLAAAAHRPLFAAFCINSEPPAITSALTALISSPEDRSPAPSRGIPIFEKTYTLQLLKEAGGVSLLAIDASSLATIEARFGRQAFDDAVMLFHELLSDLWGASGCFRARDLLCCHRELSLVYLIILRKVSIV